MKYIVENKHREFYQSAGWVTLGSLWTEAQLNEMTQQLRKTLAIRLNCSESRIEQQTATNKYLQGRDLWRENVDLRRLITMRSVATVQAELSTKHSLRLAFSLLLWSGPQESLLPNVLPWAGQAASLENCCSIQGMAGAVLIALTHPTLLPPIEPVTEPSDEEDEEEPPAPIQYPGEQGETVFIAPSLSWQLPPSEEPGLFCLIGYASVSARYYIEKRDPFTHTLKTMGYSSGDRLNETLHPIVCR